MAWVLMSEREPKKNQWVVVPWRDGFKCGAYENIPGMGPRIIDRMIGKYYDGFEHWKPLTKPRVAK